MTPLFLDNSSMEKPYVGNPIHQLWGFILLYLVSLSTTRCETGSIDWEKQPRVIPLYSEASIQKIWPTKPSPTTLKHCVTLCYLCISLTTLCGSPLKHFATSWTLCVTCATFCSGWRRPSCLCTILAGLYMVCSSFCVYFSASALISWHYLCLSI